VAQAILPVPAEAKRGGNPMPDSTNNPNFRRRNLPHIEVSGKSYFITWSILDGTELSPDERNITLDCIKHFHGERYRVAIAVVMPDHVHMIFRPLQREPKVYWNLAELLKGMKGVSARTINKGRNRTGAFWQDESYDHVIRNEDDWHEKWGYILLNPVRDGLALKPERYPWSWIAE
jgi:REP element-mobilizing transposase RayT